MADFKTVQDNYSENNRLSFDQYVGLAAKFQERYGVSSGRAMAMVEETQAERQKVMDEGAVAKGGQAYVPPSKRPKS